ncbi:MAG: FAD-binding oxidoreductase [Candidatus Beckwithbacteria bacterium]
MAAVQQYLAKVNEHFAYNEKYHCFKFELVKPALLEFLAGQYISIEVGEGLRRSYSIVNQPSVNHMVELCVDVLPDGKGTGYLKNLKPGDEVKFLAPLGIFKAEQESKLLFMATGCGIAPIKSMLFDLLEDKKDTRQMVLVWGLRHAEEMFWEEELRRLEEYYKNFKLQIILSQPPEKWPLPAGHITDYIKTEMSLDKGWGIYLCGSREMVEEGKVLVESLGVPKEQIHFEKF